MNSLMNGFQNRSNSLLQNERAWTLSQSRSSLVQLVPNPNSSVPERRS